MFDEAGPSFPSDKSIRADPGVGPPCLTVELPFATELWQCVPCWGAGVASEELLEY